jgi:UPF0755 protein
VSAAKRVARIGLLLALFAVLFVFYLQYRMKNPPMPGLPGGDVIVEIPTGTSTSEIFRRLDRAGVVEDGRLAEVYYRLHRRKTPLQAGEYKFQRPMPIDEVINMMGRGDVVRHAIVVPEGLTVQETFDLFW